MIEEGDIVLELNGEPIATPVTMIGALRGA